MHLGIRTRIIKGDFNMAAKPTILTQEGYDNAVSELEELKVNGRKEIAEKIKEARSYGDLSENAEYDAAMAAQASMEQRIKDLENMLKNAEVVNSDAVSSDAVTIGSVVKIKDMEFGDEDTYTIVGSTESDPYNFKISDESPVGRALVGREAGDIVDVELPGGSIVKYEILEISK